MSLFVLEDTGKVPLWKFKINEALGVGTTVSNPIRRLVCQNERMFFTLTETFTEKGSGVGWMKDWRWRCFCISNFDSPDLFHICSYLVLLCILNSALNCSALKCKSFIISQAWTVSAKGYSSNERQVSGVGSNGLQSIEMTQYHFLLFPRLGCLV